MDKPARLKAWKYHLIILASAILVISTGAWIRQGISANADKPEEGSVIAVLQTEIQQLRTAVRRSDLESIQEIVASAAEKTLPAVVWIVPAAPELDRVETVNDYRDRRVPGPIDTDELPASASGLLLDLHGHVLTSAFVAQNSGAFRVKLGSSDERPAHLLAADTEEHLALLKLDTVDPLPAPARFSSREPSPGSWLIRLGRNSAGQRSLALGLVSSIRKAGKGHPAYLLDSDAAPELDGGPAINLGSEVAGINVLVGDSRRSLVIPIAHAMAVAEKLKAGPAPADSSWIGIEIQDLTDSMKSAMSSPAGVLVTSVRPGGPAQRAGLRIMDVIFQTGENDVGAAAGFLQSVRTVSPGTKLVLAVRRGARNLRIELETAPLSGPGSQAVPGPGDEFGLEFSSVRSPEGLVIAAVQADSRAARAGLLPGDMLGAINTNLVRTAADFARLQRSPLGREIQVWLIRRGQQSFGVAIEKEGSQ